MRTGPDAPGDALPGRSTRHGRFALPTIVSLVVVFTLTAGCTGGVRPDKPRAGTCGLPARAEVPVEGARTDLPRTRSPALVVLPGTVHPTSEFAALLDAALARAPGRNVVLFVHGRGAHPAKAINQRILARLAAEYGVTPIMLTWPSTGTLFPAEKALAAGPALADVLSALRDYKNAHPDLAGQVRFTLLTHSMGSIVLEGFLSGYQGGLPPDLLDNLVINASASAVDHHAEWIERIDFATGIYITYGRQDPALAAAGIKLRNTRLGRSGARQDGDEENMADNAVYVDFSDASWRHRFYIGKGEQPCVYQFFNDALNGNHPDLDNPDLATVAIPGRDYIINE